jgi:hypothetical protein
VDRLGRSGRVLLTVAVVGLAACAAKGGGEAIGVSLPRGAPGGGGGRGDGGLGKPSPVARDFRERMVRLDDRQLSRGHAERFDAIVWANDVARAAWDDALAPMPDGAMLVEEAIERAAQGDRPAGLLVMEKRDGSWRFVAVGADGEVVDDARVARCATCHREAPRDSVFPVGPPQPKTTTTSAAMTMTAPTAVAAAAATHEARIAGSVALPSSR